MSPICSAILQLLLLATQVATPAAQSTPPAKSTQPAQPAEATTPAKGAQAAQGETPPPKAGEFPTDKIEQIVAPIALYPDSLLAQIMMASTYPLEIVEAARWSAKNPKITPDKVDAAIKDQTWDPSVKSLCGLPDVLKRMNENLDWTQDLGDAFLGQKELVMKTVQAMRRKAYEAGNLKSGKEQTVTEQADKIIIVEAANPEVVYVPTYYPTSVYGSWGYPYYYYPPMYPPYPAGGVMFGFTVGVIWGSAMWGGCNWGGNDVNINVNKYNNFNQRTEINGGRNQVGNSVGADGKWKHNAEHRKGVGYKNDKVAQQYGGGPGQTRVSKDQARGYGDRSAQSGLGSSGDRANAGAPSNRAGTGAGDRAAPRAGDAGASARAGTQPTRSSSGLSSGANSGSRSSGMDRAGSSRGSSSRGSAGARGGGGGRR